MPRVCVPLVSAYLMIAAAALSPASAAEPPGVTERMREQVLRMTDLFDTALPGVLGKNNLALTVRPKFSDFRDYEFLRVPFELRYGLTRRWELQGGLVPFTPNPFNRGRDHRWGPGEVALGARYDLGPLLGFFDESTIGLRTRVPVGHPPIRLINHYTHVKPFVTAARQLRRWPSTKFYTSISYDRTVDLTDRAPPPSRVTRRDELEVAPGLLYKPTEFGYFTEYRLRHIREPDRLRLVHEAQIGTIWDVPLARTEKRGIPGKWQLELAYRVRTESGRGDGHDLAARVNWRTTLREVLDRGRAFKAR